MKKLVLYGLLLVLVMAGIWGYTLYSRKMPDIVQSTPDLVVSATDLIAAFQQNSKEAEKKYNGKVLRVSGTVTQINAAGSVVLGDSSTTSEIVIGLDQRHKSDVQNVKTGMPAVFQGVYSGYEHASGSDDLLSSLGATIHLHAAGLINED